MIVLFYSKEENPAILIKLQLYNSCLINLQPF